MAESETILEETGYTILTRKLMINLYPYSKNQSRVRIGRQANITTPSDEKKKKMEDMRRIALTDCRGVAERVIDRKENQDGQCQ